MTLDQYGHLLGDRLDVVADALDVARRTALTGSPDVYPLCTEGEGDTAGALRDPALDKAE